jgi:hypothetical protein
VNEHDLPPNAERTTDPARHWWLLAAAALAVAVVVLVAVIVLGGGDDEGQVTPPAETAPGATTEAAPTTTTEAPVGPDEEFYGGSAYWQQNGLAAADPTKGGTIFPVGVWDGGVADVDFWKEAGVNLYVGQLYYEPTVLDNIELAGLSLIGAQENIQRPESPNVIGWRAFQINGRDSTWDDEPDLYKEDLGRCVPPEEYDAAMEQIKQSDPARLTYVNFGFTPLQHLGYFTQNRGPDCDGEFDDYAQYAANADMVSADIYPKTVFDNGEALPLSSVGDLVSLTRQFVPGKPVCSVIEGADINPEDDQVIAPEEMRFLVVHSLVRGAACIVYFTIDGNYENSRKILDTPGLYEEMTTTNTALAAASAELNGAPSLVPVEGDDSVEAVVRSAPDGSRVLLLAETDGEAATATVTVGDLPGLELLLGAAPVSACPGGELTFELGPHGVAIVRLAGGASGVPACASSS